MLFISSRRSISWFPDEHYLELLILFLVIRAAA